MYQMRKVIGLIPLYDDERESYWMLPGYMKMLEECHTIPLMLPLTARERSWSAFSSSAAGSC